MNYLLLHDYKFFHTPNETYTTSWNQKRKNRALGVVRGVPDLFIFKGDRKYAIELKRAQGGRTSPDQREWLEVLAHHGFIAAVCHGAVEAIELLEEVEHE